MPRYIDRPQACDRCGGPVQIVVGNAADAGGFVQQADGLRHAQFPDYGGADDDCRRAPSA